MNEAAPTNQRPSQLFDECKGVDVKKKELMAKCRSPASYERNGKRKTAAGQARAAPRGAVQSDTRAVSWLRRERDA